MIVAGMNEGSWPKSLAANPWMSRPMQATLGLHMPEVNSSRMAHDVMMIMHAPRVVFSRAIKEHGAETLESRWLQRLRACCHALPANTFAHVFNNATYSAWLEQIKQADRNVSPVTRPEPKPPVSVRPTSFSVTALERLQRDPYAIYAERILRLRPLEPLGDMAQHKIFGNLVHHMLEIWSAEFLTTNASTLSNKTKEKLIDNAIAQYALDETQRYIWHPKLSAILDWVISTHEARSSNILEVKAEQQLNMKIQGKHTEYTIKGRADRIEIARDGRVVVVDYKTGTVPTKKDITNFIACQLPLECLMLMQMETHNQNSIASFEHWALSSKAGKARIIPADKKLEMNTFLAEIKTHITHLLDRYMDVEMAYAAVPDESLKPRYHTYAQLERYAEWI
jgi:ATP-dependent helicase/nuclease subunit B